MSNTGTMSDEWWRRSDRGYRVGSIV